MNILTHKRCTKCGEWKLRDRFQKQKDKRDGLSSWCMDCANENTRRWHNEHREQQNAKALDSYHQNKEPYRIARKRYYAEHKEEMIAKACLWQKENKDKVNEKNRKYKKEHPEQGLAHLRNRRARLAEVGGTITPKEWKALKKKYNYTCLCCGRKEPEIELHLDHVIPVSLGGPNVIENAQPLCKSCNSAKHTKTTDYR